MDWMRFGSILCIFIQLLLVFLLQVIMTTTYSNFTVVGLMKLTCSWRHPIWPPPKRPGRDSTICVCEARNGGICDGGRVNECDGKGGRGGSFRGGGSRGGSRSFGRSGGRSSSGRSFRSSSSGSYRGRVTTGVTYTTVTTRTTVIQTRYSRSRYSSSRIGAVYWSYYPLYYYQAGLYSRRNNYPSDTTLCENYEADVNGTAIGWFKCPFPFEPSSHTACCGDQYAEFCCIPEYGLSGGEIAAIVITVLIIISILACWIWLCIWRR